MFFSNPAHLQSLLNVLFRSLWFLRSVKPIYWPTLHSLMWIFCFFLITFLSFHVLRHTLSYCQQIWHNQIFVACICNLQNGNCSVARVMSRQQKKADLWISYVKKTTLVSHGLCIHFYTSVYSKMYRLYTLWPPPRFLLSALSTLFPPLVQSTLQRHGPGF